MSGERKARQGLDGQTVTSRHAVRPGSHKRTWGFDDGTDHRAAGRGPAGAAGEVLKRAENT